MLNKGKWRKVSWRRGAKGPLTSRLPGSRFRVTDGKTQRILYKGQQMPRRIG
jgi:hypothetical protein